jgi:hypothetical protein
MDREDRRSFFDKGAGALVLILGGKELDHDFALTGIAHRQRLLERHAQDR